MLTFKLLKFGELSEGLQMAEELEVYLVLGEERVNFLNKISETGYDVDNYRVKNDDKV